MESNPQRHCPRCGTPVAQRAESCLMCGAVLKEQKKQRLPLPQGDLLWPLLVVAALVAGGCREPEPDRAPAPTAPPMAEQVRAVREGRTDRIDAATPLGADDWEALRGLAGLRVLVLSSGVAGDTEAEILASLPDLEWVVLRQSPLSDAGFSALAGCRSLTDLNVPSPGCRGSSRCT